MKEKELKADSLQSFYNYALGKPYQDKALSVQAEDITNNLNTELDAPVLMRKEPYKWISVGIDWGQHFHWINVLGMRSNGVVETINLHKVPKSEGVDHIEEDLRAVINFCNQYSPNIIVADLGFNGNYVVKLAQYFDKPNQRIVYGVKTRTARSNGDPDAHWSENEGKVAIDKLTQVVKMMYNIKASRVRFYGKLDENLTLLIQHWDNVIIRDELPDDGDITKAYKAITRKGDDHFAISSVYAMVGMEKVMQMVKGSTSSGHFTTLSTVATNQNDFDAANMFKDVQKTKINYDLY